MPDCPPTPGSPLLRRWSGAAVVLVALPTLAVAADPASPDAKAKGGDPLAIESRTDRPDGSAALTVGRRLQTDWDAKLGVDVGVAPPMSTTPPPDAWLNGWTRQDRSTGVGWANVLLPIAPLGWDKAAIEARVDPAQDQGRLATTLSRSVPLGDDARVTVRNGYSLTETLGGPGAVLVAPTTKAGPPSPVTFGQALATDGGVSLDLLGSATTFAAGARYSTSDEKWLRTLSAEQKLFNTPFSVTGTISERPTGETDRSIKAGIKGNW